MWVAGREVSKASFRKVLTRNQTAQKDTVSQVITASGGGSRSEGASSRGCRVSVPFFGPCYCRVLLTHLGIPELLGRSSVTTCLGAFLGRSGLPLIQNNRSTLAFSLNKMQCHVPTSIRVEE